MMTIMTTVREVIAILDNYDPKGIPCRYLPDSGWRETATRMSWLRRKIILAAPTCTLWAWYEPWGGYRFRPVGDRFMWQQQFAISAYEYAIASVVEAGFRPVRLQLNLDVP